MRLLMKAQPMGRMHRLLAVRWIALALSIASLQGLHAQDSALEGLRTVQAVTRDGTRIPIGTVLFTPVNARLVQFKVSMDSTRFTDYFLSMKEFKCLESVIEISCHVPYPYRNPQTIQDGNLVWLEHSLLFLFKQPRDFGAKLWNGSYYRLERQGSALLGHPQAIDLNHISAPSATPDLPPYSPDMRDDVRPGTRWIDHLLIE